MSWIKLVKSVKSCCIRGPQFGSVAKSTRFKLSKIYCIRQNYSQPIPAKFCSKWRWATCDTEKNWFLGESCRRRGHIISWTGSAGSIQVVLSHLSQTCSPSYCDYASNWSIVSKHHLKCNRRLVHLLWLQHGFFYTIHAWPWVWLSSRSGWYLKSPFRTDFVV